MWITVGAAGRKTSRARGRLKRAASARSLPLYGIPFAVKDNFDVEGMPTTAACPTFAHEAAETATVVKKLLDAGAILIGKTNMDQFATGLVGTRTPYGICSSVFNPKYISGGSSSGSAVAVARGLVSFSLWEQTRRARGACPRPSTTGGTQANARPAEHAWFAARLPHA